MKWNAKDVNEYNLPCRAKFVLTTAGIDASKILYLCEFCDCFNLTDDLVCIGAITGKYLVINQKGNLFLQDDFDLIPIAESIDSFIEINEYLYGVDFSKTVNWEYVLADLSRIDQVSITSSFWREFIEYLHDSGQ